MQKLALPKVLVLIAFILVNIIAVSNVSFAHPLATKYVTVTAKNDPGGIVQITYTYGGVVYGPYNTTSVETIKIPEGATVTFTAIPLNGFGFYGFNYTFEPYSMITSSTKFTFSTSQTLTFNDVTSSITAIAYFPVKLTIIDPAIWDYVTTSEGYYISFVGGVAFANNDSLVPSSLVSQNTFTLNVEVQAVGSSTVVSGSVSLKYSGSVLYISNKELFTVYDPNGLEMKYATITWTSPKPWLYLSGTIWRANDWAWGISVTVKPGNSIVEWTLPFQNLNFQLQGFVESPPSSTTVYFPSGSSPSFYDSPLSGYAFLEWYMIESTSSALAGKEFSSNSNPWTFNLPSNSFSQAYNGPWFTLEPNVVQTKVTFDVNAPSEAVGTKVSLTLTFPNGTQQTQTQTLVSATGSALATPGTSATFTWTSIPVGSYSWSILPTAITYSSPYGTESATAYPSSGSFTLSSTNNGTYTQGITYSSGVVNVTFTEKGLANGLKWWVELGTVNESAITPNPIIFYNVPARSTISYKVENPILTNNGWVKYQTSQASGTISTGITNITQQITYNTYYLVNVIFKPNYGTSNPQTVWVQAGNSQTFELTPEEDYYIAQPYSSSITAPSGITINYNSISKTTSGNTYVYNVPVTVNAPGTITVSLTWFNFIDYISESGLPSGQSWSFVIYQNGQQQSTNTIVGSPVSIEEPGYDYSTNNYYQYTITFSAINVGNGIYYVPTSISTSAVDVLSKTSNSVTFEITGNSENNTNIITVTYTAFYELTINAGSGGSVSWSVLSGSAWTPSSGFVTSGTVNTGQSQTVYVTSGAELQLTDNPNSGYAFTSWSFSGYVAPAQGYSSNNNPIDIDNTGSTGSVSATYQYTTYLQFTVSTTANSAISFTITLSNGQSLSGNTLTQPTVTFYVPYGTYSWSISPTSVTYYSHNIQYVYDAVPSSSSATTNATVNINYVLSSSSYQYTWSETGLPSGTQWGVNVGGTQYTTTSSSLTETFSTGQTYSWSVINPSGYVGTPSSGSFSSPGSQSITFYTTPSVSISANPSSGSAPLTVTYTASASGGSGNYEYNFYYMNNNQQYQWSGWQTSNTFTYTYNSNGEYYAMVEVEDTVTGATASSNYAQVTVAPPPLSVTISAYPTQGTAPLQVSFASNVQGGSGSYSYYWTFGDGGTSTSANPTHTYTSPGTYNVQLEVTSGSQTAYSNTITITVTQEQLQASISANPTSGTAPLTVTFTASASGGSGSYEYDFFYGSVTYSSSGWQSSNTFTYTFSSYGTYDAYVEVEDTVTGATATSSIVQITVNPPPLSVTASANPTSGGAPLTVSFSASASGGSGGYTYSWNFGDGSTSTSQNPTHTYNNPGTYTATVTVTDSYGDTASQSITINVYQTYSYKFTESGLPSYVTWSVTVNGQTKYASAGSSITFSGLTGTNSWQAPSITVSTKYGHVTYYPNPSSGTISGSGTTSITYKDPPPVFISYIFILLNFIERTINILYLVFQSVVFDFQLFTNTLHLASFLIFLLNHSFTFIEK